VEKRLQHGFDLLFAYTFSKLMTNNMTSVVNVRHYRSVSPLDRTNVFRLTAVYDLPFGPGKALLKSQHGIVARFVEGWAVSGVVTSDSGAPLSITQTNGRPIILRDPTKSGSVSSRIGDQVDPATGKVLNPYFDTSAFVPLGNQYTISPTSPYLDWLRGPRRTTINMSLVKGVQIWERVKLQLRGDASNLLNSPIWNDPGTDMSNPTTFGVIRGTASPRRILIGARLSF
jgi:hypothetical protein